MGRLGKFRFRQATLKSGRDPMGKPSAQVLRSGPHLGLLMSADGCSVKKVTGPIHSKSGR
jgi:hypothetical protein